MLIDPQEIAKNLTPDQQECIAALSDTWQDNGYSRMQADILWAIGDSRLYGKLPALVDCDYHRPQGRSPNYRHKLLPKGLEVKQVILAQ